MKKSLLIFFIAFLIGIFFLNHNYPFFAKKIGRWSVGFSFVDDPFQKLDINEENLIPYEQVDSLLNSEGNYIADPFFIFDDENYYLFTELKGEENADIALFTSTDGLNYKYEGVVLDEDFHVSYPQVFRHDGEIYMLPETKQSGNVLLYKAIDFPKKWEISDTLIKNRRLKDATILLEKNLIVAVDDYMNQLLFESDSLHGAWKESQRFNGRKGNETRPGGRFFNYKNEWYLPIQDRAYGYGSGISIYKLKEADEMISLELSEKRFLKETPEVKWFNRGMHHFDIQQVGDRYYAVYDGDQNTDGERSFQVRRTLKYNFYDLFN